MWCSICMQCLHYVRNTNARLSSCLCRAEIYFVKPKVRTKELTIPKKLNVAHLKDELRKRMDDIWYNDSWEEFKLSVYGISKGHWNWFDGNEDIDAPLDGENVMLTWVLGGGPEMSKNMKPCTRSWSIKYNVGFATNKTIRWRNKAVEIQSASNSYNVKLLKNLLWVV